MVLFENSVTHREGRLMLLLGFECPRGGIQNGNGRGSERIIYIPVSG